MSNLDKLNDSARPVRQRRRGAAAVEFAVVAPLFVLFVFGLVEYGRMVMTQQVLVNATREGARVAVLEGSTQDNVEDSVVAHCQASGMSVSTNQISCNPDPEAAEAGDPVTVTVTVPFSDVSWLPTPMYLGSSQLQAVSVMRKESSQ